MNQLETTGERTGHIARARPIATGRPIPPSGALPADIESPSRYSLPGGCVMVHDVGSYARVLMSSAMWMVAVPLIARAMARMGANRALARVQQWWGRGVLRALRVHLSIEGIEHIDSNEAYVIVPLHEGFVDAPALLQLPLDLRFVIRDELLDYRMIGSMLRTTRHIAVCPERGVFGYRRLLRDAEAALRAGESVVIFAQGTVLGIESAFHIGAFHLARALGRPILPVVLTGSHRVWEYPFSPRLRQGERMSMRVLAPVSASDVCGATPSQLRDRLQRLMKTHALDGRMAPPRRFVPARDGYWDGYAYEIDPAFAALTQDIALHRAAYAAGR